MYSKYPRQEFVFKLKTDVLSEIEYILKMPFQYKVISWSAIAPTIEVEKLLNSGWTLVGGVHYTQSRGEGCGLGHYDQALMMEKPDMNISSDDK